MNRTFGTILDRTFYRKPRLELVLGLGVMLPFMSTTDWPVYNPSHLPMPAPLLPKAELLTRLSDTFRRLGYDGASIADIATATGLGKSSLYHYFPGGKEQMAADVLSDLAHTLQANLFAPLNGDGRPDDKLKQMLDTIDAFYDGGRKACLLERLAASTDRHKLQAPLRAVFLQWMKAMETLCRDVGIPLATARIRAEDALVRIEGSLVLAAGTGDIKPFARALQAVRRSLLASV